MSGRMYSRYVPGVGGAFTVNWNHATWLGPTYAPYLPINGTVAGRL